MAVEQLAVRQGGILVAKVDVGEDKRRAMAEAMHYLAVYGQDGPCELWRRSSSRHWKPLGIHAGLPLPSPPKSIV